VRTMEQALVAALADEGIEARARAQDGPDYTGVWAGERKIASIGIHVAKGVSTHGFAVNADNDLQPFEWVVPCGLEGVRMTSVSRETARHPTLPCLRKRVAHRFAETHGLRQRLITPSRLQTSIKSHLALASAGA
jgi:lipoate-protein ligase B